MSLRWQTKLSLVLTYTAIVLLLWLTAGLLTGLLSGSRFFDDDVGAAYAVFAIPITTLAAAVGFGTVLSIAPTQSLIPSGRRYWASYLGIATISSVLAYFLVFGAFLVAGLLLPSVLRRLPDSSLPILLAVAGVLAGGLGGYVATLASRPPDGVPPPETPPG